LDHARHGGALFCEAGSTAERSGEAGSDAEPRLGGRGWTWPAAVPRSLEPCPRRQGQFPFLGGISNSISQLLDSYSASKSLASGYLPGR
jgi:hypothetical protein